MQCRPCGGYKRYADIVPLYIYMLLIWGKQYWTLIPIKINPVQGLFNIIQFITGFIPAFWATSNKSHKSQSNRKQM